MPFKYVASILIILFSGLSIASAADNALTEDQARRFIASLEDVDKLAKALEEAGDPALEINTQPKAGEEFSPYGRMIPVIKEKHQSVHKRLAAAVKPHGFSTDEWGETGDRLFIAYMAVKMDEENPGALAQMKAMDKSMLEMLPAAQRAQFESAMAMAETVEKAPAADKEVAKSVQKEMDAYVNRQQ